MCFSPPTYGVNIDPDLDSQRRSSSRQIIEIEEEEQKRSQTDPESQQIQEQKEDEPEDEEEVPRDAVADFYVQNGGHTVFCEVSIDDFYHCIQVINQVNYTDQQIQNLKKIFSTEHDTEKLRIMKYEQDAQAKQQTMATMARKRIKPENIIRMVNQQEENQNHLLDAQNQMMEMINPYHRV